jgi:hypothetical protein
MNSLHDLQKAFRDHVLTGSKLILPQVAGSEKVSAEVRLGIYADGYRLRLLEALETDYPGLLGMVGAEIFDELGRAYIEAHPSPYFNLRWYGDQLAGFLRTAQPYRERPALAEMAALEWAMTLAFDAPDVPAVTVEDMVLLPAEHWPGAAFRAHPSLRRLDFCWNVPTIWNAIDAKDAQRQHEQEYDSPVAWIVWRNTLKVYFRSLTDDEAWALDAMLSGACFAGICEGLCEWVDESDVGYHAAALLKRWVVDEFIQEIVVGS